jgi:PIN domain nuclease of toxin-antitoxin system
VGACFPWREVPVAPPPVVILLDTNAVIWLHQRHQRARPLERRARLYLSPATILELQFLVEAGRLRLRRGASVAEIASDPRWLLDEPPAGRWFSTALDLAWTRDPFDRLIVAHARVRGWKLATGDGRLIGHLRPDEGLAL